MAEEPDKKDAKPPGMNEFYIRYIPLEVALEAGENWSSLTDEQKAALGFTPPSSSSPSPLSSFLGQRLRASSVH